MKKLAAVIALSTLALGACNTADNTQSERPSVNATATVPETYAEETGLKDEPGEITEPASENIEYPPSKGEGCDMEISTYTPYGCDEIGLPIIPDGAPLEMRCAIIMSGPCTDQENAEYREYVGQVRENFEADMNG